MTEMMQVIMQAMAHQQTALSVNQSQRTESHQRMMQQISNMQQARQQQLMQQQMRMMQHCMNTNHPQIPHEGFGHVPSSLGVPIGFASLKYENGIPFDEA